MSEKEDELDTVVDYSINESLGKCITILVLLPTLPLMAKLIVKVLGTPALSWDWVTAVVPISETKVNALIP